MSLCLTGLMVHLSVGGPGCFYLLLPFPLFGVDCFLLLFCLGFGEGGGW